MKRKKVHGNKTAREGSEGDEKGWKKKKKRKERKDKKKKRRKEGKTEDKIYTICSPSSHPRPCFKTVRLFI
jgi:hypothetical protein